MAINFQEKDGKIIKEVTETTTLRVCHDTRLGVASYKLVSNELSRHNEYVEHREMQDLERSAVNGDSSSSTTPTNLETHREEHTYSMPNGSVTYEKSVASNHSNGFAHFAETAVDDNALKTVSFEQFERATKPSRQLAMVLTCNAAIPAEELSNLPSAIALCELN